MVKSANTVDKICGRHLTLINHGSQSSTNIAFKMFFFVSLGEKQNVCERIECTLDSSKNFIPEPTSSAKWRPGPEQGQATKNRLRCLDNSNNNDDDADARDVEDSETFKVLLDRTHW